MMDIKRRMWLIRITHLITIAGVVLLGLAGNYLLAFLGAVALLVVGWRGLWVWTSPDEPPKE